MIFAAALLAGCARQPLNIYMVGDSTMADRYDTIETPERGWGQVFPTFLAEEATVINHAKNGRSTKSFLAEGRWEAVMQTLSKGDVVILQFGHNDAKETDSVRFCTPEQYADNLTLMIQQAKSVGALPVLCTPIARRHYKNNELQYVHGQYPDAAKQVAEAEQKLEEAKQGVAKAKDDVAKAKDAVTHIGNDTNVNEGAIRAAEQKRAMALENLKKAISIRADGTSGR